ncbi:MAG TPA: glycosyltransferase family 4 protein [Novosphingobium sp.]|nr:glycosyltransferase family 4 protein [Novosphingobium sp.]
MHIGLCSPHWPPALGANGIVSYVAEVRRHFLARGHDVSIVSQGNLIAADGTTTALAPRGGAARVLARAGDSIAWRLDRSSGALAPLGRALAREVAAAHRIRRFDVFEMEESFGWSEMVGRAIDCPVITRLHGPHVVKPVRNLTDEQLQSDAARCRAEAHAVRLSPLVTSPTRAILDETREKYGRHPARCSLVIANPIGIAADAPRWSLDACERDHVLAIGRFDFWKGADTLLLAFDRLLETRPSARLTMVGPDEGLETAPGVRVGFEAFVEANLSRRARERITFTGKLTAAEIAPLRLRAMVQVCASRWESFPYVLLEGMAAGCPLISTAWPASGEVIVDGETGLLTPVADPGALAATLERMLGDPERAAAMGAAARRRCEAVFATEVVGDRLLECYARAIGQEPAVRAAELELQ